jgi:hypothetical protein
MPATQQEAVSIDGNSGYILRSDSTWSAAQTATSGTTVYTFGATGSVMANTSYLGGVGIDRSVLTFDISSLPADAQILSMDMSINVTSVTGTTPLVALGTTTPNPSSIVLTFTDYDATHYQGDDTITTAISSTGETDISIPAQVYDKAQEQGYITVILASQNSLPGYGAPVSPHSFTFLLSSTTLFINYYMRTYMGKINGKPLVSVTNMNRKVVPNDNFRINDVELVQGYNTFITGIESNPNPSATGANGGTDTKTRLSYKLNIPEKQIRNFSLDGTSVKCNVIGPYTIRGFNGFSGNYADLYSYRDEVGNCIAVSVQGFYNTRSLADTYLPNAGVIGDAAFDVAFSFAGKTALQSLYLPSLTALGSRGSNDSLFRGGNTSPTLRVYTNPVLQTSNLINTYTTSTAVLAGTGTLVFNQNSGQFGDPLYVNFAAGQKVSGAIIAPGTTVSSITGSFTTIVSLSSPTTNSTTLPIGEPITFEWPVAKEEGDLTWLAVVNPAGTPIRYVTNAFVPNAVTNLSVGTITATSAVLNFTTPAVNVNPISFYDVYVNDFCLYSNRITATGQAITGLTPGTFYKVSIVTADTIYNTSTKSNTITFLTPWS